MRLSQDDHTPRTPLTGITGAFSHYCVLVTQLRMKKLSATDELWHFSSGIKKNSMDCIAKTASFSSLAWQPCAFLRMRSLAISLKVDKNRLTIY